MSRGSDHPKVQWSYNYLGTWRRANYIFLAAGALVLFLLALFVLFHLLLQLLDSLLGCTIKLNAHGTPAHAEPTTHKKYNQYTTQSTTPQQNHTA